MRFVHSRLQMLDVPFRRPFIDFPMRCVRFRTMAMHSSMALISPIPIMIYDDEGHMMPSSLAGNLPPHVGVEQLATQLDSMCMQ